MTEYLQIVIQYAQEMFEFLLPYLVAILGMLFTARILLAIFREAVRI